MNKISTKKNLIYNMIYQVVVLILPLITSPYLSRIVGASGIGTYSYYYSIAYYFVHISMLGVINLGNRAVAKCRDDKLERSKTFSSNYYLQAVTSVIALIVFTVYAIFFTGEDQLIACLFILYVASAFFDVSWLYFGMQLFKITSIRQVIIRLLTFISIFIFVKNADDLWVYTLIMSLGYLLSAFSLWVMMWNKVSFVKVQPREVLKNLVPSIILFVPIIATSIYRVMAKIMIGAFCTMEDVGYFENAEKMITISLGLISAFSAVLMPKISNLIGNGESERAKKLLNSSMELAMCIGVALAFGIACVSNEFVPIFFGEEFKPSIFLSIVLCTTIPFITWACIVRTLYLIPAEKDKIYLQSVVVGAIIDLICNFIFIPLLGVRGATIGTILAEISVAVYQTIRVRKELPILKYAKQTIWFILFGIIMAVFVRLIALALPYSIWGLVIEVIVGAIFYLTVSLIYFIITKNEILFNLISTIKKKFNK